MVKPKYDIGHKFSTRGKHQKLCQVIDILRTYNTAGDLVKISYIANHSFMGQIITDYDITETTIAMGSSL